ncbi:hypothetical protein D3C78_894590 [compost metagenome]
MEIMFAGIMTQRALRPAVDFFLGLLVTRQPQFGQRELTINLHFSNRARTATIVVPDLACKHIYRIVHRCSLGYKKASHQTRLSLISVQVFLIS